MILVQITKKTLNFVAKAWETLARHSLCPIIGENIPSLVRTTLVTGLTAEYDFNIVQFIFKEINDQTVVGSNMIFAFPCMLMQIY